MNHRRCRAEISWSDLPCHRYNLVSSDRNASGRVRPDTIVVLKGRRMRLKSRKTSTAVGLFAGIGGIELGLQQCHWETELLCEIDPGAQQVLKKRFKGIPVKADVRDIRSLPKVDLVAAGFPCQDLKSSGSDGRNPRQSIERRGGGVPAAQ